MMRKQVRSLLSTKSDAITMRPCNLPYKSGCNTHMLKGVAVIDCKCFAFLSDTLLGI